MPENSNQPSVDFLILADKAEAVNGKLYMMGGGWDRLNMVDFAHPASFSLALGISVPWLATNISHDLQIRVETQDGTELAKMGLSFNTGRPPVLGQGDSQRVVLAFGLALMLPGPGTYVAKSYINDTENKKAVFHATLLQKPSATMPPSR